MRHAARAILVALFAFLMAAPPAAAETGKEAARAVVRTLVQEVHGAVAADELEVEARRAQVRQAISDAFALDRWQRLLLGERKLTDEQREAFRDLLPGFLARLHFEHLAGNLAGEPEITGVRAVRGDVLVSVDFPRAEGGDLTVDYRLRGAEGQDPRITDILFGGTSFLLIMRDDFGAIIEDRGIEGLLAHMRENAD